MMNRTVQHGYERDSMPDFEMMKKLMKDESMEEIREQEITKIRQIHSGEHKRDPEGTKQFVKDSLSHRLSRHMNLDEIYRIPPLFTWRC